MNTYIGSATSCNLCECFVRNIINYIKPIHRYIFFHFFSQAPIPMNDKNPNYVQLIHL